jgi:transposase
MGNGRKPLSPSLDRKIINFPGDVCHEKNKKEGSMRKTKGYLRSLERKQKIVGKMVVGIDPAKDKHQAVVLDEDHMQRGPSFSFQRSYEGYNEKLWEKLHERLGSYSPEDLVFAVETACDLWKTIVDYLQRKGYQVLLVNPLTTYHSRSLMNNDYSKTDPKDALLVATNACNGNYIEHRVFGADINNLHRLSVLYSKVQKDRQAVILRMMSFMEEVFPEYLKCLNVEIDTSLYLLERYFLPGHFRDLDIDEHEWPVRRISNGQHKAKTLQKIKDHAKRSIGRDVTGEEEALRFILDQWIAEMRELNRSIKAIKKAIIALAQKTEYFDILTSVPGISELSAVRFIAECRVLGEFSHYKQIEKMAGANIRLCDSGKYSGTRRISRLGNKRLLQLIYLMGCNTSKFTPEVRIKFLKRQLKKKSYRKNVFASSSILLRLLMSLVKNKRKYEMREESLKELQRLELKYNPEKKDKNIRKNHTKKARNKAA